MKKTLFFITIFLLLYFIAAAFNSADFDLWHRLAAGKLFFANGHVAQTDIFAYTPVKDYWIDHEWGSGVVFYWIMEHFGSAGLSFLKILLMFLTFLPVYLINRMRTKEPGKYRILFYFLFLYALLFGFVYTIRSQAFTYAFFAIWMYLIELIKKGNKKLLAIFPLMTVIWANLHGGFVAGLGLLVVMGFPVTALISGFLTTINPYGFKYWQFLYEAITMERTYITEWQPLNLRGDVMIAFGFKILLIMCIITLPYLLIQLIKKVKAAQLEDNINIKAILRQINWSELIIVLLTCYLSLKHLRHNVFFVITASAYMGESFFQAISSYTSFISKKIILTLELIKDIIVYAVILLAGGLTLVFAPLQLDLKNFPYNSVEFIKINKLSGNLLVLFNWGAYSFWELYPQCKVSLDSRYEEVYPDSTVEESARFWYLDRDWTGLMKNYKTDLMLIDKTYPVYTELLTHDDWKMIYDDKMSAVFMPSIKAQGKKFMLPEYVEAKQISITKSNIGEK